MQTGLYQHPSTAATPLPVTPVRFLSQCIWILSWSNFCLQKHGCGALTESEKQTDGIGSGNPSPWVKPHSHGPLPQQNSPAVCQAHMVSFSVLNHQPFEKATHASIKQPIYMHISLSFLTYWNLSPFPTSFQVPNIPQSKPGEPASNQVNQQSVFNSLRTDMFRCFQLLTYYMSFLVKIPLSVLPAIYDIKGIETKINWTLCVALLPNVFSCSNLSEAKYHSPLLSLPNGCWDPCNPDGIAVSPSPAQKSSSVQRSGAEGKAISSEDVPEQLWMPSNILQLLQFRAALSQHSHRIVRDPHPLFTGEMGEKPISLGSS